MNNSEENTNVTESVVNILGTEYDITFDADDEDLDGETRYYKNQINVRSVENLLSVGDTDEEKKARFKEVVRHELIHAFLFESGNEEYARDERLVSLLSILSPKIFNLFQNLNIL